jgi:large subunit ribosomal protein L10
LAITKEEKREVVKQYTDWLEKSDALILTEYIGLSNQELQDLRHSVREAGGEFHIVKNTMGKLAFAEGAFKDADEFFKDTTAIGFAFEDPPALAKAITDFAKGSDFLKIKGGYLDNRKMSIQDVKALANMPALPVMRATLLSAILAPASQLVRTLAEPGRQIAAVLKAFSETDTDAQAAEA